MSRSASSHTTPLVPTWQRQLRSGKQQFSAWWSGRTPRERRLLRVGALAVALTLLWTLGLRPALDSISRSREHLPRLHAEAARIDALILEAQTLQRRQAGRVPVNELPDALRASLRRAGLDTAAVLQDGPGGTTGTPLREWEITLSDASAAHVMEWLAGLPYLLHARIKTLTLVRSRLDGRDQPGRVDGSIILQWPGEDSR